jgi:hypothetical protein
MNIDNSERDFTPQLFLIRFKFKNFQPQSVGLIIVKSDSTLEYNNHQLYLSWNSRFILAPPDSSCVLTNADPEPSILL